MSRLQGSSRIRAPRDVKAGRRGAPFTVSGSDTIVAEATRVEDCGSPPRMTNATSIKAYSSFRYEVETEIDLRESGVGRSGQTFHGDNPVKPGQSRGNGAHAESRANA